MEKINVAELLKDCPKGMELDCYLFNGLEFDHMDTDNENYPIVCRAKNSEGEYYTHTFTKYGWYTSHYDYAKCVIFPKGKTTWEGFQKPFKDGDIVFVNDEYSDATFTYVAILKRIENNDSVFVHCFYNYDDDVFSTHEYLCDGYNTRFATEEEKAKLFDAIKANGYKWNSETKTLEKLVEPKFKIGDRIKHILGREEIATVIGVEKFHYNIDSKVGTTSFSISLQREWELVPDKFDITTLKPFESRVLVRNDDGQYWIPAFWGCKRADGYTTTFGWCKYCIPFDGNEHLLGTTDDCDEYFKIWG